MPRDVAASRCRDCLAGVARDAALCHLRYSDQNFFGSSTGREISMWNTGNVSDLLDNLTIRASSSERRFATGVVDFTSFQKIYALVQCTRDLAPETCNTCLRDEIGYIPQCCEAKTRGESDRRELLPPVRSSSLL
ncbi:unnamed protein product [Spirodela intermedia]|uniref:Gnk2-homologous domain-containing protein n=1 Tax=Spirodela intermedia TaxID=51605 RepID=A0A7I8JF38_SPIIN|nr:unnamed protein product [Spirodela intermedia]CAA6668747.1 unnamed protein product [Spirodela intermedia]